MNDFDIISDYDFDDLASSDLIESLSSNDPFIMTFSLEQDTNSILIDIHNELVMIRHIGTTLQGLLILCICVPRIKAIARRTTNRSKKEARRND